MQTTEHNPADYASSHWMPHETNAEHAERVEKAELTACGLLGDVVKARRELLEVTMQALFGMGGDRYRRQRDAAVNAHDAAIEAAKSLYNRTCDEIMRTGEYSEKTDREWTALCDPERAARMWPEVYGSRVVRVGDHDAEAA